MNRAAWFTAGCLFAVVSFAVGLYLCWGFAVVWRAL